MNMTDPIADFLTRVRNALRAHHKIVEAPASKLKIQIAQILRDEGYISGYRVLEDGARRRLELRLKYGPGNEPVISNIQRVSRPGCRVYVGSRAVPQVLGGLGVNILSTPKGVMTGRSARRQRVGGEILCQVW